MGDPLQVRQAVEPQERSVFAEAALCHPATVAEGQGAVRDKIARHLGYGRTTIERAGAVVEAARGGARSVRTYSKCFRDVQRNRRSTMTSVNVPPWEVS
jgi:hypothetical protein